MNSTAAVPPIWLLITCTGLSQLAMTLVLPANTIIMDDFGAQYGVAQMMLTTFLISIGVGQLFVGYLSDRFGRRPVLVIGLGGFFVGCLISALAPAIEILLLGRVLQGVGAAAAVAIPRAIIRDSYSRARGSTVMSYLLLAVGLVPMVSPAIGGLLLNVVTWRTLFYLMAATSIAGVVSVLMFLPETATTGEAKGKFKFTKSTLTLLLHPAFIGYITSIAFGTAMYHVFNAGSPYLMAEVLQRNPADFGFYFAAAGAMFLMGSLLSARLSERVGADRMIVLASIPIIVGLALFWMLSGWAHPIALFGPISLLMFSNGFTIPNATTGALSVRPEFAGTAAGLSGFFQFGVGALSTMIVGFTLDETRFPMLVALSICGALTLFGAALGMRTRRM